MLKTANIHVRGTTPLLMANGEMSNPLNELTEAKKEITSKHKKTRADYEAIFKLEWFGFLYLDNGKLVIPGEMVEKTLRNGAAINRQGKSIETAVMAPDNYPLTYSGSQDIEALSKDENFRFIKMCTVPSTKARVPVCRPIFRDWACKFSVNYNSDLIEADIIKRAVIDAGVYHGFGTWRTRYGKFELVDFVV